MAVLEALGVDYACHARAAHAIAETYFKTENVLAKLAENCGLRPAPGQLELRQPPA